MTYLFDELDQFCVRTNKLFNKCIYTFRSSGCCYSKKKKKKKKIHEGTWYPKILDLI